MTIVYLNAFEDQNFTTAVQFDTTHVHWTSITGGSQFSSVAGRTGQALRIIMDGVNVRTMLSDHYGGLTDQAVGALYFRVATAPATSSKFIHMGSTGGVYPLRFYINTTGQVLANCSSGADRTTVGSYADDAWHRLDFHVNCTGTTHVLKWAVDGADQTDATGTGTAGLGIRRVFFGSDSVGHNLTILLDDVVLSDAAVDYKINGGAAYNVGYLLPEADGTHNAGTNVIEDQAGNDITTGAAALINEIPPEAADYIRQVAAGVGNYAEVTFGQTSQSNILAVNGMLYGSSADASNPDGTTRIVDSSNGTLVDLFSGNMGVGSTTLRSVLLRVPDPGGNGWTQAELNGVKARVGFSSNASAVQIPRWAFLMLQYAYGAGAPTTRKYRQVVSPNRW